MAKRKKKPDVTEMTTEELARHVFPKKVVDELMRIAHQDDEKESKPKAPERNSSQE